MILTCPKCASRFLLSAQVLAPEGRFVRCSSCSEEWFQLPDPDELIDNIENEIEEIPESVKPVPEGSSVPALAEGQDDVEGGRNRANLAGYMGALIVFLGVLGMLAVSKEAVLKAWPPGASFYEMIGMDAHAPGEGLVFDQVKASMGATGEIVVEGKIVNLTAEIAALPVLEVSVRDEAGDEIQSKLNRLPFDEINPETTLPFKYAYKVEGGDADHLQIRFVLRDLSEKAQAVVSAENVQGGQDEGAKTVSKGAGNTQALHADDYAEPPGGAAH